jgi:pyruvate kinase
MSNHYRHTKIIFTIGPATASEAVMEQMLDAGVDICRFNMAHATTDQVEAMITQLRAVGKRKGRRIGVMIDIKGPEIRTGLLDAAVELEKGQLLDLVSLPANYKKQEGILSVDVNYPDLHKDIHVGDTILVDNGLIQLQTKEKGEGHIRAEVMIPGKLGNRRHINLPGVRVNLPCVTEKDMKDIEMGVRLNVSYFALSFVRDPQDVHQLRNILSKKGSKALIISKIEDQCAISNLEGIVRATDALMVARGDLGIECPYEQLPIIQRRAVELCIEHAKPVIVATHMLESMITAAVPTRAEVSDVANAIFEQTDAIMLSGETSVGKYPLECVQVMDNIARAIERTDHFLSPVEVPLKTPKEKMLHSAMVLAQDMDQAGIVVFTRNGYLARKLSSMRPLHSPIFAFTDDILVFEQLRLSWGVIPNIIEFSHKDPEGTIIEALDMLKTQQLIHSGEWLVVITNVLAGARIIETIQMRQVE